MRRLAVVTLLLASASFLSAAGWNKPYFAATKPGSYATYKSTSTVGPPSTYTMTRLAERLVGITREMIDAPQLAH